MKGINNMLLMTLSGWLIWQIGTTEVSGMGEKLYELDPYVVTGTRTMHRLSESPVRTELLTSQDLDYSGACSFADAVELLPGIRIENNCQNCGTSDLILLGLEGKYTAILIDGMPLISGLASVYGLDQIPAIFIDRIEVVKGGGSSIYGSGAVGGVVNIIGHRPLESGGLLDFRMNNIKGKKGWQTSGITDYVSENKRTALSVYGQVAKNDPVDLNGDGFSDLTKRELEVFGVRWVQNWESGTLRIDGNRTSEFRRGGDLFELPDNLANISERIDTQRDSASLSWEQSLSTDLDFRVSGGFAYTDRKTYYGGLFGHAADQLLLLESSPGAGDNNQAYIERGYRTHGEVAQDQFGFTENWVYNAEIQANYSWERHQTTMGIQYYGEKIDDIVPVSTFVVEYPVVAEVVRGDTIGLFVQDDWHLTEKLELVFGLRADKNSEVDDLILSPRVSLRHETRDNLVLRTTFGTGFRAPQPFDEDLHIELIAGERAVTRQAENLKEEKSHTGLLSAIWSPRFADGNLTIEATTFYTAIKGTFTNSEIRQDAITGGPFRLRYNGPDAEVGGLELNIGALPHPDLRVDIGYVGQFARFKDAVVYFEDELGNTILEANFLETPRHYGVLNFTWTNQHIANVVLNFVYTGSMKQINERTGFLNEKTDSFLVANLTFSRTFSFQSFPDVTLIFGVKNIGDDRQKDIESSVDRDPYYLYGPRVPRTWFLGTSIRF